MDDGTALIELRRRKGPSLWAVVDADDFEMVDRYRWRASIKSNTTYARASMLVDGQRIELMLHRFLLAPDGDVQVDHRDGNGLNNRRSNLRIATVTQNRGNIRKFTRPATSRYKGVSRANAGKWQVKIAGVYLGCYASPEEGARVYDAAARERYGEFACLNFPDDSSRTAAAS